MIEKIIEAAILIVLYFGLTYAYRDKVNSKPNGKYQHG